MSSKGSKFSRITFQLTQLVRHYLLFYLPRKSYSVPLTNKTETLYFENIPVDTDDDSSYKKLTTTTNYFYNNPLHHQLTQQKTTYPDNTVSTSNFVYAHEKGNQKLINAHMIGIPLATEVKENGKVLNKSETKYDSPIHLFPTSALSFDLQNPVTGSTELSYDQYDSKGNLQQYTTRNGISTTIIWGYNQTQPIAKIEGAKLSDIPQALIDNIVNASVNDGQLSTEASEQSLISALDLFRNNAALSAYQISTYSYDPLIGVKSITPPSGIREVYKYDTANRLEKVIDINGKVLKEYKYNYKN